MDNKIKELRGQSIIKKSHEIWSYNNGENLYRSSSLLPTNSKGCLILVIFIVSFITAFRSEELANLKLEDFTFPTCSDLECFSVTDHTGLCVDSAKALHKGLKILICKPPKILIRRMKQFCGMVSDAEDSESYIGIVSRLRKPITKFLFEIRYGQGAAGIREFYCDLLQYMNLK